MVDYIVLALRHIWSNWPVEYFLVLLIIYGLMSFTPPGHFKN